MSGLRKINLKKENSENLEITTKFNISIKILFSIDFILNPKYFPFRQPTPLFGVHQKVWGKLGSV